MRKLGTRGSAGLSLDASEVRRFSGLWVAIEKGRGVVSHAATLKDVLRKTSVVKGGAKPYVFRVPATRDLDPFDLTAQWNRGRERRTLSR